MPNQCTEAQSEETTTDQQRRDTLLPKLLSGELQVKPAEKILEAKL